MKKLSLAYFGTPDFSATFLELILKDPEIPVEVQLVVTQPDKPAGRQRILTPTPVKMVAQRFNIHLYEGKVKSLLPEIKNTHFDLALLYAYGEIIPNDLIKHFSMGFWNIHPSLLPLYRNVAPMAYPLILGDMKTGVSIIQLDDQLDHGPLLTQKEMSIALSDKRTDLEKKLTELAFQNFKELVQQLAEGNPPRTIEQNHEKATYTRMMKKDDGYMPVETLKRYLENKEIPESELPDIAKEYVKKYPNNTRISPSSLILYDLYRGLFPWPGIWTKVHVNGTERRLKITQMRYENDHVVLEKVQLEGKNEIDFPTFLKAYHLD